MIYTRKVIIFILGWDSSFSYKSESWHQNSTRCVKISIEQNFVGSQFPCSAVYVTSNSSETLNTQNIHKITLTQCVNKYLKPMMTQSITYQSITKVTGTLERCLNP